MERSTRVGTGGLIAQLDMTAGCTGDDRMWELKERCADEERMDGWRRDIELNEGFEEEESNLRQREREVGLIDGG